MHHFIAIEEKQNYFQLLEQDIFQIKVVLKLKNFENIICIFKNHHYLSKVIIINKIYYFKKTKLIDNYNELTHNLIMVIGLIRKVRFEFLLQKSTELGISAIVPFVFKRSVVRISSDNRDKKLKRWRSIIKEAVEQSNRNKIPILYPILSNITQLSNYKQNNNFVFELNGSKSLNEFNFCSENKSTTFVVGCEGGFENYELDQFKNIGYDSINLGKQTFRTETAALYGCAVLHYLLNN